MKKNTSTLVRTLNDLTALLADMADLHQCLETLVRSKTDAMRAAEIDKVRLTTVQEQAIVTRINEREGLRRQIMDRLGTHLDMAAGSARSMTMSQLQRRVPKECRARLGEAVGLLQTAVADLARVNRIAMGIARGVVGHFQSVFEAVAAGDGVSVGYSHTGGTVTGKDAKILDAVG